VIRWLALLLVLLVLPAPRFGAANGRAVHAGSGATVWGFQPPPPDASVADCDDDDDDNDSVPPGPERSDDDVLSTSVSVVIVPGALLGAVWLSDDIGVGPARGHARTMDPPPRSA
jgi:hypothetical protein